MPATNKFIVRSNTLFFQQQNSGLFLCTNVVLTLLVLLIAIQGHYYISPVLITGATFLPFEKKISRDEAVFVGRYGIPTSSLQATRFLLVCLFVGCIYLLWYIKLTLPGMVCQCPNDSLLEFTYTWQDISFWCSLLYSFLGLLPSAAPLWHSHNNMSFLLFFEQLFPELVWYSQVSITNTIIFREYNHSW